MITAARRKASLAGLMFVKLTLCWWCATAGTTSKPVILWATDSGSVEVYFSE